MSGNSNQLKGFAFWISYLKAISLLFAFLGILWSVLGSFDPFGWYEKAFAQRFWNADILPKDAKTAFRFILGPFGATSAGYFILQYFIAQYAYARRQMWGYQAIVTAFFVWLFLDTTMCLIHKGYFNILFANLPSLLAMLPVFFTKRYFT
ncbi:MAG: hypothetical protein ICV51_08745 [Flavisolibacter sp.]|nr:hypothetical protein [Flavisolibacter sp.]MBD0286523.1 hypothetical protein [Flavisolibacter sp.]MBD0298221.1 hypothetical protein [Flavisolibacter sp.]MBD0349547.1 hypothetical protein [Flavisolibacter sp.]MBD0367878.1 hypothetical protein [Flavisolibacter sp.]